MIELQRAAGNRAVVQLLRKPIGASFGTVIGHTTSVGDPLGDTFRARSEYVPRGQRPGAWAGFLGEFAATVFARTQPTVCAVVRDVEARYHVLDTGRPAGSYPAMAVQSRRARKGAPFTIVRWMNLTSELDPFAWRRKRDAAADAYKAFTSPKGSAGTAWGRMRRARRARRDAEAAFVALLGYTFGVDPSEIHVATSSSDRAPGKINFDIELPSLGRTDPNMLPAERHAPAPEATLVIGPEGATQQASALVQGTLVHEEAHLRHTRRAIELWSRWARSRTRKDLEGWLKDQRVSEAERELTLEKRATKRIKGGTEVWEAESTAGTEALAHTVDFMFSFSRVIPKTAAADAALLDLSSWAPGTAGVAEHWINAQPAVQRSVIKLLADYYDDELKDAQRRTFTAFVERKSREAKRWAATGDASSHFYAALEPFYDHLLAFGKHPTQAMPQRR